MYKNLTDSVGSLKGSLYKWDTVCLTAKSLNVIKVIGALNHK